MSASSCVPISHKGVAPGHRSGSARGSPLNHGPTLIRSSSSASAFGSFSRSALSIICVMSSSVRVVPLAMAKSVFNSSVRSARTSDKQDLFREAGLLAISRHQQNVPAPFTHRFAMSFSQSLKTGEVGLGHFDADTFGAEVGTVDHGSTEGGETAVAVSTIRTARRTCVLSSAVGEKVEFWRDPIRYPHCRNQFAINKFAYGIAG